MSDWAADIDKIVKRGKEDLGEFCSGLKVSLFNSVLMDTRVKTGRLRGNWSVQNNTFKRVEYKTLDKTGNIVRDRIVKGAEPDTKTFFVNSLPYAAEYEKKDAMIGTNVARIRNIVKEVADKL